MAKEDKDLDLLDHLKLLLSTKEHPALYLWTMRLIQAWDVPEYFIDELQSNTYVKEPWIGLQKELLKRGLDKGEVLRCHSKTMEDVLFEI